VDELLANFEVRLASKPARAGETWAAGRIALG
jgi:hypothetical protein